MLVWTPGHASLTGNETADFLSKREADGVTSTDTPPVGILQTVSYYAGLLNVMNDAVEPEVK